MKTRSLVLAALAPLVAISGANAAMDEMEAPEMRVWSAVLSEPNEESPGAALQITASKSANGSNGMVIESVALISTEVSEDDEGNMTETMSSVVCAGPIMVEGGSFMIEAAPMEEEGEMTEGDAEMADASAEASAEGDAEMADASAEASAEGDAEMADASAEASAEGDAEMADASAEASAEGDAEMADASAEASAEGDAEMAEASAEASAEGDAEMAEAEGCAFAVSGNASNRYRSWHSWDLAGSVTMGETSADFEIAGAAPAMILVPEPEPEPEEEMEEEMSEEVSEEVSEEAEEA